MNFFLTKYIKGTESPTKAYWLMWAIPSTVLNLVISSLNEAQGDWASYLQLILFLTLGVVFTYGPAITWKCAKNAKTKWGYTLSKLVSGATPILTVIRENSDPNLGHFSNTILLFVLLIGVLYVGLIVFKGAIKTLNKEKLDSLTIPILLSVASFLSWIMIITHSLNL